MINSHLLYQLSYRGMSAMLLIRKRKSSRAEKILLVHPDAISGRWPESNADIYMTLMRHNLMRCPQPLPVHLLFHRDGTDNTRCDVKDG